MEEIGKESGQDTVNSSYGFLTNHALAMLVRLIAFRLVFTSYISCHVYHDIKYSHTFSNL
jgi:hypothetical protein